MKKNATIIAIVLVFISLIIYFKQPSDYPIINIPNSPQVIVSFGDSLTFGTGSTQNNNYPAQLSEKIGINIINAGIPGDTTASALKRIDTVLQLNPDIVLITLGGNDLRKGLNKTQAFDNLENIITQLQQQGAMVVLGGLNIPLFDKGYNEEYKLLARKTGAVLVPNVLEDIFAQPKLMSDKIHPNNAGYSVMAEHFYQALAPYL